MPYYTYTSLVALYLLTVFVLGFVCVICKWNCPRWHPFSLCSEICEFMVQYFCKAKKIYLAADGQKTAWTRQNTV